MHNVLKIPKHYKTVAVRLRLIFQFTYVQYCIVKTDTWFPAVSELLWTAPEELRKKGWCPGSQKADVYSFAIILHEIIYRCEPYDSFDITAAG